MTTGFGALAEVVAPDQLKALQRNLIHRTRGCWPTSLAPRDPGHDVASSADTSEGHSGIRPQVIDLVLTMLNRGVHPVIPEKGSVGASGDLAPLAHLALGMLGEGQAEFDGEIMPALDALRRASLQPLELEAKEGLSLVNGTQAMAAFGCLDLI